jgi:hypothetical protein
MCMSDDTLGAEDRDLMLAWLPQVEDVVLAGADHSLAHPPSTDRAPWSTSYDATRSQGRSLPPTHIVRASSELTRGCLVTAGAAVSKRTSLRQARSPAASASRTRVRNQRRTTTGGRGFCNLLFAGRLLGACVSTELLLHSRSQTA